MTSQDENDFELSIGRALSLEQWLARLLSKEELNEHFITYEFPTDEHLEEYLATIDNRNEREVIELIRKFLFSSCCFPLQDQLRFDFLRAHAKSPLQGSDHIPFASMDELLRMESTRRLLISKSKGGAVPSWEGIRWVVDLLPHWPTDAISALDAYILAHAQLLPDGRLRGLCDAVSLIRAKFIVSVPGDALSTLLSLKPRQFEQLVQRLFDAMGYDTELTKATRDGGRDVIAERSDSARRERVLVECKLYDKSEVGFEHAMKLLGVVSKEPACRGVIVTTGHVTEGAANADPRIEVVGAQKLFQLLSEHLGPKWSLHVDRIICEEIPRRGGTDDLTAG